MNDIYVCIIFVLSATVFGASTSGISPGQLEVPSIFSENMVLQRGMKVPIWGRASPGMNIKVAVYDRDKELARQQVTADRKTGAWRVRLDPLPTGGRYSLLIESRSSGGQVKDRLLFTNVLVGEVWITCGQSNMIWPVSGSASRDEAVKRCSNYPDLHVANMGKQNVHEVTQTQWQTESFWGPVRWEDSAYRVPRSSKTDIPGSTSAVGYYFGRALYDYFDGKVPIGLINVGAILRAESWVDEETVESTPQIAELAGKIYPHATSRAYKGNIAPLAPYAARGVIYYQGEMNAGAPHQYRFALEALINSWRKTWDRSNMPFLVVQLPGYIKNKAGEKHKLDMDEETLAQFEGRNADHNFCYIREAQLQAYRSMSRVGLAITIDLGNPWRIHPRRKRPVGERLALQARKMVYQDQNVLAQGPVPGKIEKQGREYTIHFVHGGEGLTTDDGETVKGFEVRSPDGDFVDARAHIDGKTVAVRSDNVSDPTGVRYAWAGYPDANLCNEGGLPASPFIHPSIDFGNWDGKLSDE